MRAVQQQRVKTKIRKNDTVLVIAGKDKGKQGRVLQVDRTRGRILVEDVQKVKEHVRPNPQRQIKGGIAERESMLHISNVMLVTADGKRTRIGTHIDADGNRSRVAVREGALLENK
ncbi:MAG: 50S ribosomal protein L24 [Acidobacteria bacterium]|nr:50S ribosomal protein L24 [Acidobacteriota bacterium]